MGCFHMKMVKTGSALYLWFWPLSQTNFQLVLLTGQRVEALLLDRIFFDLLLSS